ncbi:hypothetical protein [Krasilnikovia cinnamomea]|uniref:hypothetical protein n=1 Tax=Krasilnikovia cinnamomea TaxID=349313 RepID=UPI00102B0A9D|nr:hypothetical protein [Krasilnikovia cinnamomea]
MRVALPIGAAIAVVAALLAAWAFTRPASVGGPAWPTAPAGGPFLPWPATGNATADRGLVQRAIHAWDTGGQPAISGAHTDVYPLLIHTGTPAGPVVILQGNDQSGTARIAIITGTTAKKVDGPLYVRADRRSPPPGETRQVSMITARLTDQVGQAPPPGSPALAVVLADPDTTRLRLTSTVAAIDDGHGTVRGRLAILTMHHRASAFTTTISGNGREPAWTSYADDTTIGEFQAHPLTTVGQPDAGHLAVRFPDTYAGTTTQPLVVSRRGVLGQITKDPASADGAVTVELVTHPGFTLAVRTPTDDIQLARTTLTGMQLVDGRDKVRPGEPVYAIQATDDSGNNAIYLPLAVATSSAPSSPPNPATLQWSASTTPLQPIADLDNTTTQLYVVAPTSHPNGT